MMLLRTTPILLAGALALMACQEKKAAPAPAGSAAAPNGAATLKPQTTPIKANQPFTVAWTGPNGPNDYVDVVAAGYMIVGDEIRYVRTSAGNPSKLTAPEQPGTYEVRYVQDTGPRTIIAHTSISVVP